MTLTAAPVFEFNRIDHLPLRLPPARMALQDRGDAGSSGTAHWQGSDAHRRPRAKPIGLGARDSLRLEAGLPLYGHDLDPTVSPIEGALDFAVLKRRLRRRGLSGAAPRGSPNWRRAAGAAARRVGLRVQGAPAREGAEITDEARRRGRQGDQRRLLAQPRRAADLHAGYVPPALAEPGAQLRVIVRGKRQSDHTVVASRRSSPTAICKLC